MHGDPTIGLVGPCSNFVSGPQQVEVGYDSLAELDGFAWDWGRDHDGLRIDINRLVGLLPADPPRGHRRDRAASTSSSASAASRTTTIACGRSRRAIGPSSPATRSSITSAGGRSWAAESTTGALMQENQRRFRAKWASNGASSGLPGRGRPARETARTAALPARRRLRRGPARKRPRPFAVEVAPGGGLRLRIDQERPRLSLCMIVRDSARTLPACLESIRPWVDEMVIVDTGSVDETPRIVESFGGRLFHFPWCDDFSAARNESLRHARGDWLFWMDSDDTIPPECGRKLRALDRTATSTRACWASSCRSTARAGGDDGGPELDVTVVDHVKLFRNRPDLRFDGRIHEQILPAIRGAGRQGRLDRPLRRAFRLGPEPGGRRRRSCSATCACSSSSWRSGPSIRSRCSTWG